MCFIPPGDTVWATFAIVSGDSLPDIARHANDARAKAYNLGWIDIPPISIEGDNAKVVPINFNLSQNYSNPLNPGTTIEFDLPKTRQVTLNIFNILGEEVATLVSDRLSTGSYSYEWDARGTLPVASTCTDYMRATMSSRGRWC